MSCGNWKEGDPFRTSGRDGIAECRLLVAASVSLPGLGVAEESLQSEDAQIFGHPTRGVEHLAVRGIPQSSAGG